MLRSCRQLQLWWPHLPVSPLPSWAPCRGFSNPSFILLLWHPPALQCKHGLEDSEGAGGGLTARDWREATVSLSKHSFALQSCLCSCPHSLHPLPPMPPTCCHEAAGGHPSCPAPGLPNLPCWTNWMPLQQMPPSAGELATLLLPPSFPSLATKQLLPV